MHIALLGLPHAGKTTILEAVVEQHSEQPVGRGSTIRVRTGQAKVIDPRITRLAADFVTRSTVYATLTFTDYQIPEGLLEPGKPLPVQLLNEFRGADGLILVVRAFEDPSVFAPNGVDPLRDAKATQDELLFNDYAFLTSRVEKIASELKRGHKEMEKERPLIERLLAAVDAETPLRLVDLTDDDEKAIRSYGLLTRRPALVLVNTGEDGSYTHAEELATWAKSQGMGLLAVRGKVEQ
ncbi:MAG: hypothetical protein ABI743_10310, partial [bacterium]